MPYTLIIDIAVAVLSRGHDRVMPVTLEQASAMRLRRDKKDLENLAKTFGESTLRAEDNINQLRTM